MKVIIVPGNGNATPSTAWYQYVQNQLQSMGYEVTLESMPDADLARLSYRLPWLIQKTAGMSDVLLIGHSSGAELILRYLEQYQANTVVLIGAQYTDLGIDSEKQSGYYDHPREWDTIKKNAKVIIQFASTDDPYIPIHEAHTIRDQLESEYYEFPRKGHFMDTEFPELIQVLKSKLTDGPISVNAFVPAVSSVAFESSIDQPNSHYVGSSTHVVAPTHIPVLNGFGDDEEEIVVSQHTRLSKLAWLIPFIVLGLLGRLVYQKYFNNISNLLDSDFLMPSTISDISGSKIISSTSSSPLDEASLDAFLAEEGLSTDDFEISQNTMTGIVSNTGIQKSNPDLGGKNGGSGVINEIIIPDLNDDNQVQIGDDTVQITPLSADEVSQITKYYIDTKKISQTALEVEKKLRKNFGIGDIFVQFVTSNDHQNDRIQLIKGDQIKTFPVGYAGQGTNCYASKIAIFGSKSEYLVYPTNCKDVYVFDTTVSKNFVKQGQILYMHNKQIIIGIKSVDGYTDLYTYDQYGWRKLATQTVQSIKTDNRATYLLSRDSVTILDMATLNPLTTIPLKGMKTKAIVKDAGFVYIVLEKADGGLIIQKYNILDGAMVGSASASHFDL